MLNVLTIAVEIYTNYKDFTNSALIQSWWYKNNELPYTASIVRNNLKHLGNEKWFAFHSAFVNLLFRLITNENLYDSWCYNEWRQAARV